VTPLGASNNHLFFALGGRLGYALSGEYSQSAQSFEQTRLGYFEIVLPEQAVTTTHAGFNQNASLKFSNFNAMASAEAGIRWKIGDNFSLYTGVYVDYGLLNIAPKRTEQALVMFTGMSGNNQNFAHNSILTAHAPDYYTLVGGQQLTYHRNENGYANRVNNFAAGVKIKIAFGKTKKTPPPPPPPIIEAPQEIPEEPVIVEEEVVVVEEPVTEIPQEIVRSMMNLSNTLFEFDRWNLSAAAITELETVMKWLNDNPSIHIEIEGHTDNVGAEAYNQRLSEERAKSVYDYFVANGVRSERLTFRGYGFSRPIADNATPEGRQQNRRVELKIIQ